MCDRRPPRRPDEMSSIELRLSASASPDLARSLFTVRAAISFARPRLTPRCSSLSLTCSYCPSRLGLDPRALTLLLHSAFCMSQACPYCRKVRSRQHGERPHRRAPRPPQDDEPGGQARADPRLRAERAGDELADALRAVTPRARLGPWVPSYEENGARSGLVTGSFVTRLLSLYVATAVSSTSPGATQASALLPVTRASTVSAVTSPLQVARVTR